jgi:hypothetical protein
MPWLFERGSAGVGARAASLDRGFGVLNVKMLSLLGILILPRSFQTAPGTPLPNQLNAGCSNWVPEAESFFAVISAT